jgi:glycosyltransferase involved in cell wall biosynthesis
MGVATMTYPYSQYVEPSRNFAIQNARTEWVFILDADERITDEVVQEINEKISSQEHSYYMIPRRNIISRKKWLKYGGWYPDYIIRLIKKSAFVSWPREIHSTPQINGSMGKLVHALDHYFQPSIEFMVNKTLIYEHIESDLLFKAGRKVSTLILFRKFFGELYRRLIFNKGFLDGTYGIIESFYQAFSKTITYIFLYEKYNADTLKKF